MISILIGNIFGLLAFYISSCITDVLFIQGVLFGGVSVGFNLMSYADMKEKEFTWLWFVNRWVFQFFCIRLTKNFNYEVKSFDLEQVSLVPSGGMSIGGSIRDSEVTSFWSIQYFVVPLTGWDNGQMLYLTNKPKYLKLTKAKKHEI